ncbi:MAG: hypothetical protein KDB80_18405 [Planctomycetes bacterium]|nr:hypothetical protein [Planctomycetota bacterium]
MASTTNSGSAADTSLLRRIRWPIAITVVVSVARMVGEVRGSITNLSGGRLAALGITWLAFVFGAWFGYWLARSGSAPRVRFAPLWGAVMLLVIVVAIGWQFGPFLERIPDAQTFAELRPAVRTLCGIASTLALLAFVVWPRLAWTMLAYGIAVRAFVVAQTWLAKHQGWDTHYTKFGPPGCEPADMSTTMFAAATAQMGFWVAFTVVGGVFAGSVFGRRSSRSSAVS